jgi:hypothetical protein
MVQMKSSLGLGQKTMNTIASKCLIYFLWFNNEN